MTLEVNGTKVKVNHKSTDIGGTSLKGYLHIRHADLLAKLGKGVNNSGDGKTRREWELEAQIGGEKVVATIYDWKESKPISNVTKWHIGGYYTHDKALALIRLIFPNHQLIKW
jgi:hypothetical protein